MPSRRAKAQDGGPLPPYIAPGTATPARDYSYKTSAANTLRCLLIKPRILRPLFRYIYETRRFAATYGDLVPLHEEVTEDRKPTHQATVRTTCVHIPVTVSYDTKALLVQPTSTPLD